MEICFYDAKVRKDEITTRWLGTAIANIYFYHGTVVEVNSSYISLKICISFPIIE